MRRHPAVVSGKVVGRRSMAEDVHEQEAVWSEPRSDFLQQHLVVLHVFEHLWTQLVRAMTHAAVAV